MFEPAFRLPVVVLMVRLLATMVMPPVPVTWPVIDEAVVVVPALSRTVLLPAVTVVPPVTEMVPFVVEMLIAALFVETVESPSTVLIDTAPPLST